ncbi:MAG: nuclear transport factor 2 family protein [Croceibacterium sp.]
MKSNWLAVPVVLSLAACTANAPPSGGGIDAQTQALLDKVAIADLLGSYYGNFGGTAADAFDRYYTDDATFDVNGHVAHGKKEIEGIYGGLAASGDSPATRGTFHMLMTNPVITVAGDTATASLLWTGILNPKVDAPPQFVEQGREYDRLVKQNGKWLISKRVVIADSGLPASFKDTYTPRKGYDVTKD